MARLWTAFKVLTVVAMVAFGTIWLFSILKSEETPLLYPARIDRDCAPWDGIAFTVSIPWNQAAILYISIYQSPEITHPGTFSFPDETLRIGNAYLLLPDGSPEQLTGRVFFERVHAGKSVEGRFDLISASSEKLTGTFRAEWGNQVVYCG